MFNIKEEWGLMLRCKIECEFMFLRESKYCTFLNS